MCLLFETVKIFDGKPENLVLHDKRMNLSRQKLFGSDKELHLSGFIKVPGEYKGGTVRCRVTYGNSMISTEFSHYIRANIKTLKLVHAGALKYDLKYLDRSALTSLINKDLADDILIVKDGFITDTSFTNIAFKDGGSWKTPDTPLLSGTMREKLLNEGIIIAERITVDDLNRFSHFRLFNSMLGFDSPVLPVSNILHF